MLASLTLTGPCLAQTVGAPAKHNNNTYGSPLDTLKSSRLWTDTPEPQAFVRESRPNAGTLDYAPLTGSDPQRPKPRDAANVAALQAEMEQAGAHLADKAAHPRHGAKNGSAKPAPSRPGSARSAAAGASSGSPTAQAGAAAAD